MNSNLCQIEVDVDFTRFLTLSPGLNLSRMRFNTLKLNLKFYNSMFILFIFNLTSNSKDFSFHNYII